MIILDKTEVTGWEAAIRGMRNPMNSWETSDTIFNANGEYHDICGNSGPTNHNEDIIMGWNDYDLMTKLADGGSVHAKYRRMVTVYVDITAPLYWWKEFDTYKVGTVANSCSTMHKIHEKEFTTKDFSCEYLERLHKTGVSNDLIHMQKGLDDDGVLVSGYDVLNLTVITLNHYRKQYLETNNKEYWWQMIQLLPSSYNQKRTVMMNYEVLAGIYKCRRDHKLDEWQGFCKWIEILPYSEIITGIREDKKNG